VFIPKSLAVGRSDGMSLLPGIHLSRYPMVFARLHG
jgi:hypothetical protein